jgi:hypothetical protein
MSGQDENNPSNGSSNVNGFGGSGTEPPLDDSSIQDLIGRELQVMYQDIVAEPVPERLRKLIEKLARKEPKS